MKLKYLSAFTTILFILSLVVHTRENLRGTDLIAGSDFVKGLDVNSIHKIKIGFKDDKSITLERDGERFVLADHKSYPASNAKINDLIFNIANLQVKEKATSMADEADLKRFELDDTNRQFHIGIYDSEGRKKVGFSVGKIHNGGRYLLKDEKKDVYLSANSLWLDSSHKDFVETVLVELDQKDIEEVSLESDRKLQFARDGDGFKLKSPEGLNVKEEKIKNYVSSLGKISFDDFYQYNDPEVYGLKYKHAKVKLKNDLIYKFGVAKKGESHYLKVSALIEEMPKQFTLSKDDGVDKLQGIESVVKAQGEAQRFNLDKSGWVYKVQKDVYEKLVKKSSHFIDS